MGVQSDQLICEKIEVSFCGGPAGWAVCVDGGARAFGQICRSGVDEDRLTTIVLPPRKIREF